MLSLARVAGALAGFATQVVLARTLHASALGVFYSVTSLAAVVGLVAAHGYPTIAPRFMSRYREQGKEGWIAAFVTRARKDAALLAAIATACALAVAAWWPSLSLEARLHSPLPRCPFRQCALETQRVACHQRSGALRSPISPTPASGRSCCSAACSFSLLLASRWPRATSRGY
ncbi:MAG: hypothetical protein R3D30_03300 [Hyphomicrobiales bacterium]